MHKDKSILQLAVVVLLLTFLIGCDDKKDLSIANNSFNNISVSITNTSLIKYSELFDSIRIIKLETRDESIIGRVDKIIYYDNKYYIMDQIMSKAVYVFDINGQFIRRIGQVGNGPGEYSESNDIAIDPYSKRIVVYNNNGKNLLAYNFDGEFIEEIKLDFFIKSFTVLAEDIYALYIDYTLNDIPESLKYNLLIVNKDGKILGKAFDMEDQIGIGMGGFSFFQRISNEEVLLAPGFENKIYTLTPDTLVPKYYIDFGENNVPYNFFSEGSKHEISNDLRETNFTYLSSYIETTDFLVFKFPLQGVLYNGIYCKKTGKYKIANIFMNDINMITGGSIMASHGDNTIISMYEPRNVNSLKEIYTLSSDKNKLKSYLIKQFDSYFSNGKALIDYKAYRDELETTDFTISEDDIEFVNSINPGDNPILIIGNLKNF